MNNLYRREHHPLLIRFLKAIIINANVCMDRNVQYVCHMAARGIAERQLKNIRLSQSTKAQPETGDHLKGREYSEALSIFAAGAGPAGAGPADADVAMPADAAAAMAMLADAAIVAMPADPDRNREPSPSFSV